MDEWQPIETAPKDGRTVLVCVADSHFDPSIAHYEDAWGVLQADFSFHILNERPTHWMPLPAPPTGE